MKNNILNYHLKMNNKIIFSILCFQFKNMKLNNKKKKGWPFNYNKRKKNKLRLQKSKEIKRKKIRNLLQQKLLKKKSSQVFLVEQLIIICLFSYLSFNIIFINLINLDI